MPLENAWTVRQIDHALRCKESSIVQRMLAVFYARQHNNLEALKALTSGLWHSSVLLRHEIAYVIGQMGLPESLDILIRLLDNKKEHPMVRHEAGEAIAAIGCPTPEAFECLRRHLNDPNQAVRETVQLSITGLNNKRAKMAKNGTLSVKENGAAQTKNPNKLYEGFYIFTGTRRDDNEITDETLFQTDNDNSDLQIQYQMTIDPAEGDKSRQKAEEVSALGKILKDAKCSLWDRYVAMFTLRNISTRAAAKELAEALDDTSSALLRHEICFVLGQMQLPICIEKLIERLADLKEVDMVRHEAALAIGSVGADIWTASGRHARLKALAALKEFLTDSDRVVAESCAVALHNIEWETGVSNDKTVIE